MMFPDCTDAGVSPKMLDPTAGTAPGASGPSFPPQHRLLLGFQVECWGHPWFRLFRFESSCESSWFSLDLELNTLS
jgi:hypothetical protein